MPRLALAFDVFANDTASRSLDRIGDKVERTGKRINRSMGGLSNTVGRPLLALAGAGGVGALVGSSVKLAATFETTMRQVAVATDTPAGKLKDLNSLALKMGTDTTFSAQQAGAAMLELAKGGLSSAEIKAGALASTLTLASAGGLDLGNAASYVVQGLSLFADTGATAADVAAALAGGANASTASVEDMGLALSQVGPGAATAGLSLQETTAVLAAFAQNGIRGSDAGTSLKTMLTRLIPTTKKSAAEMKKLGLNFVDANGEFKSITNIADQLQDKLGKLSDAERTAALATIFGSDATRAATILAKEGAAGLAKYIKATNDKTQADKLAKAATSGTAGALSQMSGSVETAQIALGTALAPAVVDMAQKVSAFANGPLTQQVIPAISSFVRGMQNGTGPGGTFAGVVDELGDAAGAAWGAAKPLFSFIGDHPKLFAEVAKDAAILAVAFKGISTVKKLPGLGTLLGGGKGGLLAGVTKAAPLPVFVTNPGFGGPGGDLPGKDKGKGKLPVAPVAARSVALGIGSVLLTSGDAGPKSDAQKQNRDYILALDKLSEATKGHNEARTQLLLKAAGINFKTSDAANRNRVGTRDLVAAYDFLVKYGKQTEEVRDKIAELAKDPRVAAALKERAAQADRNIRLISGGFLTLERQSQLSATKAGVSIGNGIGAGTRAALLRLDQLDAKQVTPKVKLTGAQAASKDAVDLLGQLKRLDGFTSTPKVVLELQAFQTSLRNVEKATGVPGDAAGGWVRGPGTGTSDSILRRASNGEFVMRARQASRWGRELEAMNAGREPALASARATAASSGQTYGDVYVTVTDNRTALSVPEQLRQDAWLKGF